MRLLQLCWECSPRALTPRSLSGRWSCVLLAAAVLVATGCARKPENAGGASGASASVVEGPPITNEEAEVFAESLLVAVHGGADPGVLHVDALADRVIADAPVSAKLQADFRRGFGPAISNYLQSIAGEINGGASYDLLHVHDHADGKRVMMRLVPADGGVNYHDYVLARTAEGVRAVDVEILVTGELISQTMQRMFLQLVAGQDMGFLGKLTGKTSLMAKNLENVRTMQLNMKTQPQVTLDTYHNLPEELKSDKLILTMRVAAAGMVGNDEEYKAALEAMREHYAGDPSAALHAIDYHLLNKEFAECSEAIETLDRAVGGDPYLNVMRAGLLAEQDKYPEAWDVLRAAIKQEPDLDDLYWTGIGLGLKKGDHAATLDWLKVMDAALPQEWQDFRLLPDYAGFVASPQHGEWLAYLKSKNSAGSP